MDRLPLEGIRVLDITVVWAGPFGTMILADLGAEVIRVENIHIWVPFSRGIMARPSREWMKAQTPFYGGYPDREPGERPWNRCPIFQSHARNKLSCTMDLRKPKGMELFKRLVQTSDVVYENNVPETMKKLGITYDMLKTVKQDIIYLQAPAYGSTGPYKNYRAFGNHIEGVIGHTLMRHYPDMGPSEISPIYVGDYMAGVHGAFAVMAALYYRSRTGKGQLIELSQAESAMPIFGQAILDYTMNRRIAKTIGNRDPTAAPCGCYPCRGDDRWVNITVTSDKEWQAFCRVLGDPPWTKQQKFSNVLGRWKNQDELDGHINEWTKQYDSYEVMHLLQEVGVAAGAVMDARDCYNDPHMKARGFFQEVSQEDTGTHLYPGMMWKFSKTPLGIRTPPVRLGEHNEYVYKELLKVSDDE